MTRLVSLTKVLYKEASFKLDDIQKENVILSTRRQRVDEAARSRGERSYWMAYLAMKETLPLTDSIYDSWARHRESPMVALCWRQLGS